MVSLDYRLRTLPCRFSFATVLPKKQGLYRTIMLKCSVDTGRR